jgi:hypothetical protein
VIGCRRSKRRTKANVRSKVGIIARHNERRNSSIALGKEFSTCEVLALTENHTDREVSCLT